MRNFLPLVRRELGVYFVSPMAYIILTVILVIAGLVFMASIENQVAYRLPADYMGTLMGLVLLVLVTGAIVTMRLVAEEKSKGTLEMILTAPITDAEFVLAKFTAAVALLAYLLLPTFGFVMILSSYGRVDLGAVLCGYLGVFLMGGMMYAIGLFISSLCTSQVTAGVVTFALGILLVMSIMVAPFLPEEAVLRQVLQVFSLTANFEDFLKGVIDTGKLVFLLSVIGFFLFLTTRVIESRRWR